MNKQDLIAYALMLALVLVVWLGLRHVSKAMGEGNEYDA